jgi:hypothetical protein
LTKEHIEECKTMPGRKENKKTYNSQNVHKFSIWQYRCQVDNYGKMRRFLSGTTKKIDWQWHHRGLDMAGFLLVVMAPNGFVSMAPSTPPGASWTLNQSQWQSTRIYSIWT